MKVTGRGLLFTLGAPEPCRWLFPVTADTQLSPISCSPGTFGRISCHGSLPLSYSTVSVGKRTCAPLQGPCCVLLSQAKQSLPRKGLGRKVLFTSCHFFIYSWSLLQALSVHQWQMQPLFTVSLLSQICTIHMVGEPSPSLSPDALPS